MKRNKRGFIKLICASLIAYNLTATVNGKEYKDNQSNEKNISIVENAVQDYIERVEKSAVPGSLIAVGNLEYSDGYKFIDRVLYDDNDEGFAECDTLLLQLYDDTYAYPQEDIDGMDLDLNGGPINFVIRAEDLKNRDFSRVLAQWACT